MAVWPPLRSWGCQCGKMVRQRVDIGKIDKMFGEMTRRIEELEAEVHGLRKEVNKMRRTKDRWADIEDDSIHDEKDVAEESRTMEYEKEPDIEKTPERKHQYTARCNAEEEEGFEKEVRAHSVVKDKIAAIEMKLTGSSVQKEAGEQQKTIESWWDYKVQDEEWTDWETLDTRNMRDYSPIRIGVPGEMIMEYHNGPDGYQRIRRYRSKKIPKLAENTSVERRQQRVGV